MKQFLSHCNMIEDDLNYYNKDSFLSLFDNKNESKTSQYLKVLNTIEVKAKKDDKFLSKIFGTKEGYSIFLRENIEWMLDN